VRAAPVAFGRIVGTRLLPKRYVDDVRVADASTIGDLCDISSGVYADTYVPAAARGAVAYVRVNNVREFVPNLTPCDVEHVMFKPEWGERVRAAAGDVVIARTGTLGRAFVVPKSLDGAVMSQHVTRVRLRDHSVDRAQLLAAYLNSKQGKAQVMSFASGSTRLELTHDDINRIRIPRRLFSTRLPAGTPEGVEADFAAAVDASVSAFHACDGLLPSAGIPEQFFSTPFGEAGFVESLAPRFHRPSRAALESKLLDRYECVELGQIALVRRGAGNLSAEYEDSGLPYIRTSSIINYGIELFPEYYGSERTYRAHGQNVGPGDILLTMEGKIGALALLGDQERCLIKNHVEVIRLHRTSPVPAEIVYAFLSSHVGQTQIERRTVVQATIPGLGSESRRLLIPIAGRSARARAQFDSVLGRAVESVKRAQAMRSRLRAHLRALVDAVER
jgi:hypothetical protein